ncbi:penicillin acylase family protein [Granulosicoccaceae sp. 1_MG-2023]|nr:penicillin acylase family protein [Granulosicoccaceae sp. 1_MG-2023]
MRVSVGVFALSLGLLAGCGDSDSSDNSDGGGSTVGESAYAATIRYTAYGVPHISADNYASLGYGVGYDQARNNMCTLSEQLLKLKGDKSRYFGAGTGNANLLTDVAYKALDYTAQAEALFDTLSDDAQDLLTGYAAGFNRSLAERQSPADYPSPCRGAEWVTTITATDLLAYQLDLAGLASSRNFLSAMTAAQPPQAQTAALKADLDAKRVLTSEGIGSNGWALGEERVEDANGLLLGNPHFPWDGELRFYQHHLTVPGELDIYGVTMMGLPAVVIGFNEHLGWTHTVSQSKRFTFYQLTLDENDPTRYLYDGEYRDMTSKTVTVEVKQADGSLADYSQAVYFSHYGPIVNLASLSSALGWTETSAVTFRDANAGNSRMLEQWLAMGKAQDKEAFVASFSEHQGIPWVNTLMIDDKGTAGFIDATQTPKLSATAEQYWRAASQSAQLAALWQDGAGSIILPGDSSAYEWVDSGETLTPGLVPFDEAPVQLRSDYVFNANSSHWLSNADAPLEGYSIVYGPEQTIRSPRTRYNAQLIGDTSGQGLAGADNRFSFEELKSVLTDNGSLFGGDWKNLLTQRCSNYPTVNYEGAAYDLTAACQALINWDGKYNTDSMGAHLMREFLAKFLVSGHRALSDSLFATGFDAEAPATTPSGIAAIDTENPEEDTILQALASAAAALSDAGIALDEPLGNVQYVVKAEGETALPIAGGNSFEGTFNQAETDTNSRSTSDFANVPTGTAVGDSLLYALDEDGDGSDELAYRVNYGTSFVLALQFGDDGPQADMFLSYSQDHDPEAAHFKDQTELYSALAWRPVLISEQDIAAAVVETITLEE